MSNVEPLTKQSCLKLRNEAHDDLAVVKGQYKKWYGGSAKKMKMAHQKNSDGIATNQNKFFFDIIKWGSMLLL